MRKTIYILNKREQSLLRPSCTVAVITYYLLGFIPIYSSQILVK